MIEINTKFNTIVIGIYIIIDTFENLCAKNFHNVSIYIASCSEFIYSKVATNAKVVHFVQGRHLCCFLYEDLFFVPPDIVNKNII